MKHKPGSRRAKSGGLTTDIRNGDLEQMIAEVRRKAWLRKGKFDTVQRLRKDKGFARAVVQAAKELVINQRAPFFRDAMNAAIRQRPIFERNLREGKGIWFDEMQPLAPKERTWVMVKLRQMWGIPESEMTRPDIPAKPAVLH